MFSQFRTFILPKLQYYVQTFRPVFKLHRRNVLLKMLMLLNLLVYYRRKIIATKYILNACLNYKHSLSNISLHWHVHKKQ